MKIISKISVAIIAIASTLALRAQTAPARSSGLLGQRYVEVGAGVIDPHGSSDTGLAAAASVNLPMPGALDVGFGYAYGRLNSSLLSGTFEQRVRDHALFATATAYTNVGDTKPFLSAGLGYQWAKNDLRFGGTTVANARDNQAIWGLAVGAEIPLGSVTLTPRLSYQDGFRQSSGGFTYGTEVHTWFTPSVGGFAGVAFSDPQHGSVATTAGGTGSVAIFNSSGSGVESWAYTVGARFRF